jgi:hypothetical protein
MSVLKYFIFAALGIGAFLLWRISSVGRGMRKRDEKLAQELGDLANKLERKAVIDSQEVLALAGKPQLRCMLFALLKHFHRGDLFPSQFLSQEAQREAKLAYWMMHPNELQAAPEQMELIEKVTRTIDEKQMVFFVYRYRMPAGHWAGDAWLLGLAGPFGSEEMPYEGGAGAFSRCNDKHGVTSPTELVDWFIGIARAKRN